MKNLKFNRTGNDLLSTIPLAPESKLVSLSQIRKASKPIDTTTDIVKDLLLLNKKLNQIIKCVQSQNDVLQERANGLESEISDCRDTIMLLSTRMDAINSMYARLQIENHSDDELKKGPTTTLTVDTTIEYLKEQPIFLDAFSTDKFDDHLLDMILNLDTDVRTVFLEYSFHQLERVSQCFETYFELGKCVESDNFIELISIYVSKIFNSNLVYIFQVNSSTGEYYCKFKSKNLIITLKDSNSLIFTAIHSQSVTFYTNPSENANFSPSLDPLFNPDNKPILFIPILKEATILIIQTDKTKVNFTFTNEDILIAKLFESLISPLFHHHNQYQELNKKEKNCQIMQQFQNELSNKDNFQSLLPFLSESLKKLVNSSEVRIFIAKANQIISNFGLSDGKLFESKHDFIGIPSFVIQNKFHLLVDFLNTTTVTCFSEDIDGWALEKPFGAFPIFQNKEKVSAVLCLTATEKLGSFEFEFITSLTPLLALIIPRCIEALDNASRSEALKTLNNYPSTVSKLTFDNFLNEKSVFNILNQIRIGVSAEFVSAYVCEKRSEGFEFARLMSLCENEIVERDFVNPDFVTFVFNSEGGVNESDPSRLPTLTPSEDVKIHSIMAVANKENEDMNLVVVCINSKSSSGSFNNAYHSYVSSFSTLISYAAFIQKKEKEIDAQKRNTTVLESTFSDCEEAMKYPNPLLALIQSILKRIQMDNFMLLRYKPLNRGYECILASEKVKKMTVSEENSLLKQIEKLSKPTKIEKNSIDTDNSIFELLPKFSVLAVLTVNPGLFLICSGKKLDSHFESYFNAFLPLVKSLYRNFLMSSQKVITATSELNKINLETTTLIDSDVVSRLFQVTSLSEPQKIEAILKIFTKFDLLTIMETTLDDFTKFLLIVRDKYRKLPYHNWTHAVDTIQFAFSAIERGRMRMFYRPHHTIAILLACLLHDIDHRGFDTSFQVKTKSPLFITYGGESTMEKHHLSVATKLVQESLITRKKMLYKDQIFWSIFLNAILATDMNKHNEYMDKFEELKNSFDSNNENNLLLLAQLIIKCANIGNCTRPFDVSVHMAKKLQEEYLIQAERERKLNVKSDENNCLDMSGNIADVEIKFCNDIANPLLTTLGTIVPELTDFAIQMEDNKKQWDEYRMNSGSKS